MFAVALLFVGAAASQQTNNAQVVIEQAQWSILYAQASVEAKQLAKTGQTNYNLQQYIQRFAENSKGTAAEIEGISSEVSNAYSNLLQGTSLLETSGQSELKTLIQAGKKH